LNISAELIKDLLIQLAQWSGHHSRINREQNYISSSIEFAYEELVIEFISAFISGYLGFSSRICTNELYIDNWIKVSKNDNSFVYRASKDAQVAATYLKDLVIQGFALIKDDVF
jgi:antirestriction protein ArdC